MSQNRSIRTDSSSSSTATSKTQPNESIMDPSNILYNNRENYQIIFSNDSRFFDTSLHLFRSYCDSGYVQLDNKKSKKSLKSSSSSNSLKPPPNKFSSTWRSKPIGFSSNHSSNGDPNGTLKSPPLRRQAQSISQHSNPKSSVVKRENVSMIASSQRSSALSKDSLMNNDDNDDDDDDDDDSDGPDIIVTRL